MTITLNGDTGITTPGLTNTGTETLVNLTTTGNTTLGDASTDTLNVGNGGLIKDASGNVGVGVTPSAWSSTFKGFQLGSTGSIWAIASGNGGTYYGNNYIYGASGRTYLTTGTAVELAMASGKFEFGIAASGTAGNPVSFTSAMTLDASGNLLVGTTTLQGKFTITATGSTTIDCARTETTTANQIVFRNGNGAVGSIQTVSSATAYLTASDYRLKEDIVPMTGALAKVIALKPVTYKWKIDGISGQGFIAHELQSIVPDAVSGEKDAVNEDGSIKAQGIDTSFLVATLTAAIQELNAKFEEYKASHP